MATNKVEKLLARGRRAFEAKKFSLAEKYWEHALTLQPRDARIICNLGMARTETGDFEGALVRFAEALELDPTCSRAHNNRAALHVRMGAELAAVLPSFILALEYSESPEDFARHAVNVCQTVAYGFDKVSSELFEEMEKSIVTGAKRFERGAKTIRDKTRSWPAFVSAYRHVAHYRQALAAKKWGEADRSLESARQTFISIGLANFADGVQRSRRVFELARAIYAFLEDVGSTADLAPTTALDRAIILHRQAVAMADEMAAASHSRLLHVLGWFLALFSNQLAALSGRASEHRNIEREVQMLIWLSSSSFKRIGNELIAVLNFCDRRLQELAVSLENVASEATTTRLRADEWTRIALFLNGQVLGFASIEVAVARSMLGWNSDPLEKIRNDLHDLKSFIERQAYKDVFVDGNPRENIARGLLQARLSTRSYREVPTRGGRSDVLAFVGSGARVLVEAKIWRGPEYHEAGIRELAEYVAGENDDKMLAGAFYVVFDPTETFRAAEYEGGTIGVRQISGVSIEVLVISLRPPIPSGRR